jgi:hypothetical protein
MSHKPDSPIAELAMKAALRDFRSVIRKSPASHPFREEMRGVLVDARRSIDRINRKQA